jgi:hypothetical protein
MKRYLYAIATGLVLGVFLFGAVPVLADSLGGGGNYGLIEAFSGVASSATSSSACGADSVVYDNNGVQGCVKLSDVAPQPLTIHPQHAYAQGTNQGADLMLAAGAGIKKVTIDAFANCGAGDNLVVMVNVGGTSTSTTLTYGTEWCSGACGSDAATATSLAAAIDALAGVSSVAVAAVAYVTLDLNTAAVAFTSESDATCTTISNGTDGKIKVPSTEVFEATGRTKTSWPADGKEIKSNNAATADVCLDYTRDSAILVYQGDCATFGTIHASVIAQGTGELSIDNDTTPGGTRQFYASAVYVSHEGSFILGGSNATMSCADSGGAGTGTCSFGATTHGISSRLITCLDADGCTLAMLETGAISDQFMYLSNAGANVVTITDSAGVSEMNGNFAMGQYDAITFRYKSDRWVEHGRSDN